MDFLAKALDIPAQEAVRRFVEMAGARVEIGQEVMLNGNTVFKADVTVALVDASGRPKRLPESMADRFRRMPES